MSCLDQIINEPEKIGSVSGTHQLLGGLWFCLSVVELHAAGRVAGFAFAGAEGNFPFPGNPLDDFGITHGSKFWAGSAKSKQIIMFFGT